MDVNETTNKYLSRIKDFRYNLGDICEEVSGTDMLSITLKGLLPDYKYSSQHLQQDKPLLHLQRSTQSRYKKKKE